MQLFRQHHRNSPYRPPREVKDHRQGDLSLYWRFVRAYLWPYRYRMLLCTFIVCINGSSVYLMAFYGRYVVDNVLMVPVNAQAQVVPQGRFDNAPANLGNRGDSAPKAARQGLSRQLDAAPPVASKTTGAGGKLLLIFIMHFGTILLINNLARVANRNQIMVGQHVTAKLRDDVHKKVLDLSLAYHKSHTSGRLLARIMSDVGVVQNQMMITIITLAQNLAAVAVGTVILLLTEWRLAVIAFLSAPLYALIWRRSRDGIIAIAREARHTNSCMYGLISQKLDAVKAIQAYGQQRRERYNFHRLGGIFLRDAVCQQRQNAGVGSACAMVASTATISIFLLGTMMVLRGEMSLGKMLFTYGSAANLFGPVLQITHVAVVFGNLMVILQRLVEILDEPIEIMPADDAVPFPVPLSRGIDLDRVTFKYGDGDAILRDVSIHVPAGKWVCIMGPSGCGKTSLLFLLARLYEPTSGRIDVDGVPLDKVDIRSLRERMALVPQEAQIFRGTVRDNITYGFPHATPNQIMAAAKAAEMHELIMGLPVKYETLIGEKGADLSGGQRQRLSLARALLTDPDVLLLDDCTSALDADTEHRIQKTLSEIMKGKTAVVVSQRVSMAQRCDHIVVLENGMITESGTHDELVANQGFYSRLYRQQTE